MLRLLKRPMVCGLLLLLAACGGGGGGGGGAVSLGGGGSGGSGGSGGAAVTAFETAEYNAQVGLSLIKASEAYARGATGAGITVGVVDSGLQTNHPDLVGQIAAGGFDFAENTAVMTDPDGHGTHVSGLIAASKNGVGMHGLAFDAKIMPLKIAYNSGNFGDDTVVAAAWDYGVAKGVPILNNSWGQQLSGPAWNPWYHAIPVVWYTSELAEAGFPVTLQAARDAVAAGVIVVFSAGNTNLGYDYYSQPGVEAGLPYLFPELKSHWVAVMAVDQNGDETYFTHRCGVAAAWCIAVAGAETKFQGGVGLESTFPTSTTKKLGGTSMAAPQASAGLAMLMDQFPALSSAQIVQRLFATANKTGDYAFTSIYGQGLMDLDAATQPISGLGFAMDDNVEGPLIDVDRSAVALGAAFGDGLQASMAGESLAVFDFFDGATFHADLGNFAQPAATGRSLGQSLGGYGRGSQMQTANFDGGQLSFNFIRTKSEGTAANPRDKNMLSKLHQLGFVSNPGNPKGAVSWGYDLPPTLGFGLHRRGVADTDGLSAGDALGIPYLSFFDRGYSVASAREIGDSWTLKTGAMLGQPGGEDSLTLAGTLAEFGYANRHLSLSFQAGAMLERGTILGTATTGAFDTRGGTPTEFAGASGTLALSQRFKLAGSLYGGVSHPLAKAGSVFTNFSDLRTEAFTVGLIGDDLFRRGDQLGVIGSQPLRVSRGSAGLSFVTGRDASGGVIRETKTAGLAPTGREVDWEAYYRVGLAAGGTFNTSLLVRTNPGHVRDAATDGTLLFRFQRAL